VSITPVLAIEMREKMSADFFISNSLTMKEIVALSSLLELASSHDASFRKLIGIIDHPRVFAIFVIVFLNEAFIVAENILKVNFMNSCINVVVILVG
jgi:hypothetical protein